MPRSRLGLPNEERIPFGTRSSSETFASKDPFFKLLFLLDILCFSFLNQEGNDREKEKELFKKNLSMRMNSSLRKALLRKRESSDKSPKKIVTQRPNTSSTRSLRSVWVRAKAQSLHSDRMSIPLGRYVATKRSLGHYVATKRSLGRYVATKRSPGHYIATGLEPKLGRYVATELEQELGRYVATELKQDHGRYVEPKLRSDRARTKVRSLRSDQALGRYVAIKRSVAT
ncbi:hypothetical protein F2Q68_00035448 [Brassica cretica]|uniref:Uncharacterized protein n=1 Tax=Brassica cretica TaxID=69181 RepID=A0A8S9H849_BRACR|nr:hypothetical protein F2Q68_00035448 [Brassica cretica]